MITVDLLRMVLVAGLAIGGLPLWVVFAVLVLVGLLAPPFDAARSALLADMLSGDAYLRGNTLVVTVHQAGQLLGFLGGGALVAVIGVRGALLCDALTFAGSAVLLWTAVRERPMPVRTGGPRSWRTETTEGLRHVAGSPRLRGLLAWAVVAAALFIVPEGLAVPVTSQLGGGPTAAGALTAAVPAGFVVGSVLLNRVPAAGREPLFLPLTLLSAGALLLTPLLDSLWLVGVAWMVAGAGNALQLVANTAYVQAVPSALRGRAFGVAVSALMAAQGLALLTAGALGDVLAPTQAVAALAALGVLAVPVVARLGHGSATRASVEAPTSRSDT